MTFLVVVLAFLFSATPRLARCSEQRHRAERGECGAAGHDQDFWPGKSADRRIPPAPRPDDFRGGAGVRPIVVAAARPLRQLPRRLAPKTGSPNLLREAVCRDRVHRRRGLRPNGHGARSQVGTWRGLRVGHRSATIPERHPAAEFVNHTWWLKTARGRCAHFRGRARVPRHAGDRERRSREDDLGVDRRSGLPLLGAVGTIAEARPGATRRRVTPAKRAFAGECPSADRTTEEQPLPRVLLRPAARTQAFNAVTGACCLPGIAGSSNSAWRPA